MNAYLLFNSLLYLALALWCIAQPEKTSTAVGYHLLAGSGRSEYLVVYGGLQIGLGIFFAYCSLRPELKNLGVQFAICLYIPIVICRLISFLRFSEIGSVTIATAALEIFLLAWALWLILKPARE